jgi:hypothetical protein
VTKSLAIFLTILFLTGCEDRYRYYCQDPDHFSAERCQKPKCEFNQDCPEYLVAPVLEKKIEGLLAQNPAQQQQQTSVNCGRN